MKLRKKKLLKIYIILIVLGMLIAFLLSKNINLFVKYRQLDAQYQQDLTKIESEQEKEIKITQEMKKLETESGQEWILIEKNNLMRPGEKKIQIIDY